MYKALILLFLCVALQFAEPAPKFPNDSDILQRNTRASAPTGCAQEIQTQFWSQSVASLGNLANCSVAGVIKNVAYILIDSADFGNTTWNDVWGIVANVSACGGQDTGVLGGIMCLLDALSNSSEYFGGILQGAEEFVADLQDILPVIMKEVDQCLDKSVQEYKVFLSDMVQKTKSCY